MGDEEFALLKNAGIGTFQVFQESYHKSVYEKYHPRGPKSDWLYRLNSLARAIDVGLDDVGIGALFGLADWRYEVLGLLYHTIYLEKACGVGPHTISFPRIEPAVNTPFTANPPHMVNDELFVQLVAILRLAVPYTGMIATCREDAEMRDTLLELGVSQIDAGSSIELKSYSMNHEDHAQFELADNRSLSEVTEQLISQNAIPSFCTACYRLGRTGEHFMEFAIPGFVKRFCTPNAILTFSEYLHDFADAPLKKKGEELIHSELEKMEDLKMRQKVEERLVQVKAGRRDLLF
jgi:2-iminoacetate synthase